MSALGQKQTCAPQNVMSSLPPRTTEIADIAGFPQGQSTSALRLKGRSSNVDLLRYCKSVIYIDTEITNGTLNFGMAE